MATVPYDVMLNSKKYLLTAGYLEYPLRETIRPGTTPGGDSTFRDNSNPEWAWWGQTKWQGEQIEEWKGDGCFWQAYGIDLWKEGQISPAKKFIQGLSDTTNPDGYLLFTDLTFATEIAVGKTTSDVWTSTDGISWTHRTYAGGASKLANSWCFYKNTIIVSMGDGTLRTTADAGVTWAAYPTLTPPNSNPAYVLGSYRGKLYVSWGTVLYTWDGTTLVLFQALDGTPVVGAVGAGSMFIFCQGIPARLYMMQADQLVELAQWASDFQPDDAVYLDNLYVSGGGKDASSGQYGEIWSLSGAGLERIYQFPQVHGAGWDYRIRSLGSRDGTLLFSYNKGAGIGVYDATLDTLVDPKFGFALGSKTAAVPTGNSQVIGIIDWQGVTNIGIAGKGLYYESGFSDYQLVSSVFGSNSKRVSKMWNLCEVTFTPFNVAQSLAVEFSVDGGVSWTALTPLTTFTTGLKKAYFSFPTNTVASTMQYRITVLSASMELDILDISMSFIEASQNPKKGWRFTIDLYGDADDPMQFNDGQPFDRDSVTMKNELDALWNQRFVFEDIFGKTWNVMMPAPSLRVDDVRRTGSDADPNTVIGVVGQYTVNLVQV